MNKLKKQMWAKCIALILAVASGLATIICTVLALIVGIVPELQGDEEAYERVVSTQVLSSYAASLWDGMDFADEDHITGLDALEGGNIRYTVQRQSGSYYEDLEDEDYVTLYSNDSSLTAEDAVCSDTFESGDNVPRYNLSSFPWAMRGAHYLSYDPQGTWWMNAEIKEVRFNEKDGLFYFVSQDKYFLVPNFTMYRYEEKERERLVQEEQYELQMQDEVLGYYALAAQEKLAAEQVKEWADGCVILQFGDWSAAFDAQKDGPSGDTALPEGEEPAGFVQIQTGSWDVPQSQVYATLSYGGALTGMDFYVAQSTKRTVYRVLLAVRDEPKEGLTLRNGSADYLYDAHALADTFYSFSRWWGWYLGFSAVLFILCMVFLMSAAGYRKEDDEIHLRWTDRLPFGIYTAVLCWVGTMAVYFIFSLVEYGFRYNEISLGLIVAGEVVPAALIMALALVYCMSIAVRIKAKKFGRYTICYYIWRPFAFCWRAVRENTAMYVKAGLIFLAVSFIELLCIASWDYYGNLMAFFLLFKLVETPVIIYILWQMERLRQGGKRIAAGDYSRPIDTKRMLWDFKKHAENLNSVSSGIAIAVDERMKSERFRTELITNVSHDIKTPLTSIINYVDLIQKEEITSQTMKEYVEVLQRQSQRLKKLIEDLMEASKASTGNLSVTMEPCDATVMLSQVVGEFTGRAQENHLELIVDAPKHPVEILADGRHLWRVLDNLMSNVCKYAIPGTRVYINLEVFHGMVIMTFRNISKSRLNISSEELMERFVRGDSSRNTEGSGLGLNIAQSLTGLMNGNMAIQVDGDLFKAIVSFQELKGNQ